MAWQPLLTGRPAADAREALAGIEDVLSEQSADIGDASYAGGHAGIALFFAYLAAARDDRHAADRAHGRLVAALEALRDQPLTLGLFSGLSGVAWTLHHLRSIEVVELDPELVDEVDAVIADAIRQTPWAWEYDLIYGLAGLGLYALDHPDAGYREEVVEAVVARLGELAEPLAGGLAWRTSPERMPPRGALRFPEGRFDLGVAHGTAGVVGLLSRIVAAELGGDAAKPLLERALRALLDSTRSEDGGSTFPGEWSADGSASCRSAWCYGDPGIVVVLLGAAMSLGDSELTDWALSVGRRACGRPADQTGVQDAGLCHGAAGLGHLYNRLYQATGDIQIARASKQWFERTLRCRNPVAGLADFPAWWPERHEYRSDLSLLSGAAGVGLALLAATSSLLPQWDRPLLLDLAPNAAVPPKGSRPTGRSAAETVG